MKVLLSWLREFAPFDLDPEELGRILGDLGTPVEEMDRLGEGLDGVVVARVLQTRPHPDADRVQLVDVDAGGREALQIVCGAFNMGHGDLVPLATVGTVMPKGMEIVRRKVRGEWSNGMLCSAPEIGLPGDPGGILILGEHHQPGTPLAEALGIEKDVLYDLEVNPNRPDAMSVAGVARDLAARLGLPFELPEPSLPTGGPGTTELARVELVAPELCGRFMARVIRGVSLEQSPPEIANRLTLLGMRPISGLVDISNYVMLELGQPNHTYDLASIEGATLRVRFARDGEVLDTLDGVTRTLTGDDGVICDGGDAPVGIAGVIGGASTEITERTSDLLLEMAWWDPMTIARTSRRLGVRTEASARFERGVDIEGMERAMARFVELLGGAHGEVSDPAVDEAGRQPDRTPILVRPARVNALLGSELSAEQMKGLLDPIGFTTEVRGEHMEVALPTWRLDSSTEIDVVEEVARHHGYSALGRTVPQSVRVGALTDRQKDRRRLRSALTGLGCSEAMYFSFLAPGDLERCGLAGDGIEIVNPLVADESVLRTALLPGLLEAVQYNAARRQFGVRLFEIGHVFRRPNGPQTELPDEREALGVVLAGCEAPEAVIVWRTIADVLAIEDTDVFNAEMPGLHPTRSAVVRVGGEPVGRVGEVDPDVLGAHDLIERIAYLEVDLDRVLAHPHGRPTYRPVSRYPSSDVDLAFVVPRSESATEVRETIAAAAGDLLDHVQLFDTYRGPGVPSDSRSLAYAIRLRSTNRTLTDADVAETRRSMIEAVERTHGATLRG